MLRTIRAALTYAGSWWLLAEGDPSSWTLGVPAVALAVLVTRRPAQDTAGPHLRLRALPGFAAFFAWRSLVAGLDVARRTLAPSLPLAPAVVTRRTTLPIGLPRILLVATLSLLPGSLGLSLDGDQITLHVLDEHAPLDADFARTERRIAALFGSADPSGDRA